MNVQAEVLQPFQHDRFYKQGEKVVMPRNVFDDLLPRGLVREASEQDSQIERKVKARAK